MCPCVLEVGQTGKPSCQFLASICNSMAPLGGLNLSKCLKKPKNVLLISLKWGLIAMVCIPWGDHLDLIRIPHVQRYVELLQDIRCPKFSWLPNILPHIFSKVIENKLSVLFQCVRSFWYDANCYGPNSSSIEFCGGIIECKRKLFERSGLP